MRAYSRPWLIAAVAGSIALVSGAPAVGQLTAWLRDIAQAQYATVLTAGVSISVLSAAAFAVLTIRDRRPMRYACIAAACAIAVSYMLVSSSGVADQDAAERFHFVEYGLIAVLFYKAWRRSSDGMLVLGPLLCGVIVGTFEEWVQWYVPVRVGEARDVALNLIAVGCGVLFALGLDPPARLVFGLQPSSRRHLVWLSTCVIVSFALFFQSVHLGYDIADRQAGVFRSRYTAEELRRFADLRAHEWRTRPPTTLTRYSREDHYLAEGIAHVRRRNQHWDAGNVQAARHENLILERYYAPVLDSPSYASPSGHRWPPEQRAQAEAADGPGFMIYDSDALGFPMFTWPPWRLWAAVIAGVGLLWRIV